MGSVEAVLAGQQPWHIEAGHVLDALQRLPDDSVHCTVTSPPYFGLRDYHLEPQVWPPREPSPLEELRNRARRPSA